MTSLISHWIYAKLEYLTGSISAISAAFTFDVSDGLMKAALALVFGFLGAAGAGAYKYIEKKLTKKK